MASDTVREIRDYLHDDDVPTCDVLERWANELEAAQAEVERLRELLNRQPKGVLMRDGKPVPLSAADQALVEEIFSTEDDDDGY